MYEKFYLYLIWVGSSDIYPDSCAFNNMKESVN